MPLPIISQTYRCTLNLGSAYGCSPVNVLHVRSTLGTAEAVAEALYASEVEGLLAPVPEVFEPTSWEVIELDGSSASYVRTRGVGSRTLCLGEDTEPIMEAAAIVSLKTAVRGPRGRGRVFVGPLGEGAQNAGKLIGTFLTDGAGIWSDFAEALVGEDCALAVASYKHSTSATVTSTQVRNYIGTQRRRLVSTRS